MPYPKLTIHFKEGAKIPEAPLDFERNGDTAVYHPSVFKKGDNFLEIIYQNISDDDTEVERNEWRAYIPWENIGVYTVYD